MSSGLPSRALTLALSLLLALGALAGLIGLAPPAFAQIHSHPDENGTPVVRSLESLRDLDDQSWQLVGYRQGPPGGPLRLRIVGYPGKLRLDHPTPLAVRSGVFQWELADLTLANPQLTADARAAAAEFDLAPLLADLDRDRPLRLRLRGGFTDLLVPPYVVAEWRQLPDAPF